MKSSRYVPDGTRRERMARVLIVGSLLTVAQCNWVVMVEAMWFVLHPTVQSIFFTAVFGLVLLTGLNVVLRAISPRLAFTKQELILLYLMQCMGAAMAAHGFMQLLLPLIGHAHWYASPENDWAELILPNLAKWLVVSDASALKDHYLGESTFYTSEHLRVWATPIFWWTLFIVAFALVMLGMNLLVRKQWVEQEKLTYPIIQLPLAIIERPRELASSRLLWLGFGISAGLDILNQLHVMFPSVPGIHLKLTNVGVYFREKPWNYVGWLPVSFYPWVIGLGYFIPLDLLFSSWFFYLYWKAQRVFMGAVGMTARGGSFSGFQGIIEQGTGAILACGLMAIWVSRRHLVKVWRTLVGHGDLDESGEPARYRTVVALMVLAFLFLIAFSERAGMAIWLAILFFVVYFLINFAITRMRVEMGIPVHDMHNAGPDQIFPPLFGTRFLGARNLTVMAQYWFFNRAHYSDFMPLQIEAFKLGDRVGGRTRSMFVAILVSVVVGVLATFWAFLHNSHQVGMAGRVEWFGWEPMERLANWLTNPLEPQAGTPVFLGIGAVTTFFFAAMRARFLWWPLHPGGYAISNSWGLACVWFPLLMVWVIKGVLLRFGGLGIYRRGMPFFMGLMLGEFVVGCLLSVYGTAFNTRVYAFWVY
jgi:hypothetical protein